MKAESFLRKIAAGASTAVLAVTLTACSHTTTATVAGTNDDYGHVATAPDTATTNTNTSPNVIAGPAKVDSSGNVYTSSAVGGAGNGSAIGTNTNINAVPARTTGSTANVTYSADTTANLNTTTNTTVTTDTTTTPVATLDTTTTTTVTTPTVTTPVVDTTATVDTPMASSTTMNDQDTTSSTTTTTTAKTHKRMRKD